MADSRQMDEKPSEGALTQRFGRRWGIVLGCCLLPILGPAGVCATILLLGGQVMGQLTPARPAFLDLSARSIWVMGAGAKSLDDLNPLSSEDLKRVRGVPGVALASPVRHGFAYAILEDERVLPINLWGMDSSATVSNSDILVAGSVGDLQRPDAIILEEAAYRLLWPGEEWRPGKVVEINQRRAEVVGLCKTTPGLQGSPNGWTRFEQLSFYAVPESQKSLAFLVCRAESELSTVEVCQRIEQQTGLRALPGDQVAEWEFAFFARKSPVEGAGSYYALFSPYALVAMTLGFALVCLGLSALARSATTRWAPGPARGWGRRMVTVLVQALGLGAAGILLALATVWAVSQTGSRPGLWDLPPRAFWMSGALAALSVSLLGGVTACAIIRFMSRGKSRSLFTATGSRTNGAAAVSLREDCFCKRVTADHCHLVSKGLREKRSYDYLPMSGVRCQPVGSRPAHSGRGPGADRHGRLMAASARGPGLFSRVAAVAVGRSPTAGKLKRGAR